MRAAVPLTWMCAPAWGTVCGDWVWNNNNAANVFCRQLGYDHGETYTFGSTNYLPQLPIVYGYRVCSGTERNLMNCADTSGKKVTGFNDDGTAIFTNDGFTIPDQDCMHGCLGTDGIL